MWQQCHAPLMACRACRARCAQQRYMHVHALTASVHRLQNCTAAQLISKKGNPHVATGALLEQSSFTDEVSIVRASNNSRTAPEYNAGLIGAASQIIALTVAQPL